jgi:hypothetical protein
MLIRQAQLDATTKHKILIDEKQESNYLQLLHVQFKLIY